MQRFYKDDYIDVDLFQDYMDSVPYIPFDKAVFNAYLADTTSRGETLEFLLNRMARIKTKNMFTSISSRSEMIRYLDSEAPMELIQMLGKTKAKSISLNEKSLERASKSSRYMEELALYGLNAKCAKASSTFTQMYYRLRGEDKEKRLERGIEVYKLGFSTKRIENRRFSYFAESILNLPREVKHGIVAEDDEIYAWFDFKGSDMRAIIALYLGDDELYKFISSYSDWYLGLTEYVYMKAGKKLDREFFLDNRKTIKEACLAISYGQSLAGSSTIPETYDLLYKFITNRPKYKAFLENIQDWVNSGYESIPINTYFGDTLFKEYDSSRGSYGGVRLKDQCLNAPTQALTAEVVMLMTNNILEKFRSMGYTEDEVSFKLYRHDEVIFRLRPHVMYDSWVFKDFEKIFIDGLPFEMEFQFGTRYTVEDPSFMQAYKDSIESNKDKITNIEVDSFDLDYLPLKGFYKLVADYVNTADDLTVIGIKDISSNSRYTFCTPLLSKEELYKMLGRILSIMAEGLDAEEWGAVFMENRDFEVDAYTDNLPIKLKNSTLNMGALTTSVSYLASVYSEDMGLPFKFKSNVFDPNIVTSYTSLPISTDLANAVKEACKVDNRLHFELK